MKSFEEIKKLVSTNNRLAELEHRIDNRYKIQVSIFGKTMFRVTLQQTWTEHSLFTIDYHDDQREFCTMGRGSNRFPIDYLNQIMPPALSLKDTRTLQTAHGILKFKWVGYGAGFYYREPPMLTHNKNASLAYRALLGCMESYQVLTDRLEEIGSLNFAKCLRKCKKPFEMKEQRDWRDICINIVRYAV